MLTRSGRFFEAEGGAESAKDWSRRLTSFEAFVRRLAGRRGVPPYDKSSCTEVRLLWRVTAIARTRTSAELERSGADAALFCFVAAVFLLCVHWKSEATGLDLTTVDAMRLYWDLVECSAPGWALTRAGVVYHFDHPALRRAQRGVEAALLAARTCSREAERGLRASQRARDFREQTRAQRRRREAVEALRKAEDVLAEAIEERTAARAEASAMQPPPNAAPFPLARFEDFVVRLALDAEVSTVFWGGVRVAAALEDRRDEA